MLLRLYYANSLPCLAFDLSLPDPPSTLPYPLGYILQLHRTSSQGLDLPSSIHALDKATWHNSLLKEVAFSLLSMTVTCTFIDGSQIHWDLEVDSRKMLDSVVDDTNQATELTDRPYRLQQPLVIQKHKRQKSILKTLLSSLVHPDRSFSYRKAVAPPPSLSQPQKDTSLMVAYFRKRARTTLVDAFRRYILTHLRQHMPEDGYFSWVAQSMLQRAEARLEVLKASGECSDLVLIRAEESESGQRERRCFLPYEDDEETLSFDDVDVDVGSLIEDDDDEDDDGSSLHTPHESLVDHRDLWGVDEEEEEEETEDNERKESIDIDISIPIHINDTNASTQSQSQSQPFPRSPTPTPSLSSTPTPTPTLPNPTHTEFHTLRTQLTHLRTLLHNTHLTTHLATQERNAAMDAYEVKSRRRAWSMGVYLGGRGRGGEGLIGLGCVYVCSPLGRCVPVTVTGESWEGEGIREEEDDSELEEGGDAIDDDAFTVVDVADECECECTFDFECDRELDNSDMDMGMFRFSPHDHDNDHESQMDSGSGRESRMRNHSHSHSHSCSQLYPSAADYPRPVGRRGDYPDPDPNPNPDRSCSREREREISSQLLHSPQSSQPQPQPQPQPPSLSSPPSLPLSLTPIPIHIFKRRHQNYNYDYEHEHQYEYEYEYEFADFDLDLNNFDVSGRGGGGSGNCSRAESGLDLEPDGLEFRFAVGRNLKEREDVKTKTKAGAGAKTKTRTLVSSLTSSLAVGRWVG